jgi:hypothetical protein
VLGVPCILPQRFHSGALAPPNSSDYNHSSGKVGCEGVRGLFRSDKSLVYHLGEWRTHPPQSRRTAPCPRRDFYFEAKKTKN